MNRQLVVAASALLASALATIAPPTIANGQDCTPALTSGHAPVGAFGAALVASGDFLAVTAPEADLMPGAPPQYPLGRAELFRYDPGTTSWQRQETLAPSPSPLTVINNPGFGTAVAIGGPQGAGSTLGRTLFFGWPDDITGGNGSVRPFFHQSPAVGWVEGDTILPPFQSATGRFGLALAAFGDHVVIGEQLSDGFAHVYRRGAVPGRWVFDTSLTAPAPGSLTGTFGRTVAAQGEWIFVGAPGFVGALHGAGSVFVYRRAPAGLWQFTQRLDGPNSNPLTADGFGSALDAEPGRLFIGANQEVSPTGGTGATYVYELAGSAWTLRQRIALPGIIASGRFGSAVDAFHDALVVGAPREPLSLTSGAAYLFERDPVSNTWYFVDQLTVAGPPMVTSGVGEAVAVGDWHAAVGASGFELVRATPAYPNRDVDRDLYLDSCEALHDPTPCPALPNSTQRVSRIHVDGSVDVLAQNTRLHADQLPPNVFGFFVVSRDFQVVPVLSPLMGQLCLGGAIGRYNAFVANTGPSGQVSTTIDPQVIPLPTGYVAAQRGESWYFQYWHREVPSGSMLRTTGFSETARVGFE